VLLWILAPRQLAELGIECELEGVRPDGFPGVAITRMRLLRMGQPLELREVRAALHDDTWQIQARLESGAVELRAQLDGRLGLAYFEDVPLEPLLEFARSELPPLRARGAVTGAARWSDGVELSLRSNETWIDLPVLGILELGTLDAVLRADRDGSLRIDSLYARGPTASLAAAGTVVATRELDLIVQLERLTPELRQWIERLRPDLLPLPAQMRIEGYSLRPRVVRLDVRNSTPAGPSAGPAPAPSEAGLMPGPQPGLVQGR